MRYCTYENGVCSSCGHATSVAGLRRECGYRKVETVQPRTPQLVRDVMPNRDAPGFLEKVRNFAAAAASHVAAGMPMASDEEIIRRHDICLACEHLIDNACTQCGCPVSRVRGYVSKLSWADQECPLGKWSKAPSDGHAP